LIVKSGIPVLQGGEEVKMNSSVMG
ncbi:MAG: hypothetical protein QG599_2170, partial [Pseudomonadota bacterium]|nr:hypothetical protein [Pseudomonadota bacterium]